MTNNTDGSATTNDITWSFGYSPAGQVVSSGASNAVFDYKEYTTSTVNQTYDGLNRDAGVAAITGGYDARGNLTKESAANAFGGSGRIFTYDEFNRLLTVADHATPSTPIITLTYDPEGRLASFADSAGGVTTLLYDGTALIGEYAGASTSIAERYVHGPGTDQPLVWFHGSGTTDRRYIYGNYQGSVIAYTNASGVVQETYQYGAYGEPEINKANPASTNPWSTSSSRFRYTGQTNLFAGTGVRLYYYKARVYDPIYGHFLQTDPIGSKDDLDLYAYVGGDPINRSDPTGLCADRYENGTCQVKVTDPANKDLVAQGKRLEKALNRWDKKINGMKDNAKVNVLDAKGNAVGQTTAGAVKQQWNNTSWTVTEKGDPRLGGQDGTADASLKGGGSVVTAALPGYEKSEGSNDMGANLLIAHDFGHIAPIGRESGFGYMYGNTTWLQNETTANRVARGLSQATGIPVPCRWVDGQCQ